jgi:ribosomal protein S14
MLFIRIKDIKNRGKFEKKELVKIQFKFLLRNLLNITSLDKNDYQRYLLTKCFLIYSLTKASKTRVSRRCIFNNRSRITTRKFGVSRIIFRELLQSGVIPGFGKAVW